MIHHGDSREVIRSLADNSIDAVVTDPPYALVSIVKRFGGENAAPAKSEGASGVYKRASAGFMGKTWDTGETAFDPAFWADVLRVLKPGGHLIAASGTRTYHRLACAVEDAGFEIRDMLSWLYGSGFPKSHDVSKGIDKALGADRLVLAQGQAVKRMIPGADQNKAGWEKTNGREYVPTVTAPGSAPAAAWQGWGTALKPACEPWVLARKPLIGTVAANVLAHGTGALNIDGCRVPVDPAADASQLRTMSRSQRTDDMHGQEWGLSKGGGDTPTVVRADGRWPANVVHDGSPEVVEAFPVAPGQQGVVKGTEPSSPFANVYGDMPSRSGRADPRNDSGSAARFFYTAKADAEDRLGSKHPTVKPTDLMRWLVRLITPPGGVVLDPFAGTGSTGVACIAEGFDFILIEREAEYVADIERRIAWARGEGRATVLEIARLDTPEKHAKAAGEDLPLFGSVA